MKLIAKSLAALAVLGMTSAAIADPVKVGMITTLSGGGASLGIDARDGRVAVEGWLEASEASAPEPARERGPELRVVFDDEDVGRGGG